MRWKLAAPPLHSAALALHIHAPRNHVRALRCAAILLMTMALAVAMVACSAATGKPGPTGPPGEQGPAGTAEPGDTTTPTGEPGPVQMINGIDAFIFNDSATGGMDKDPQTIDVSGNFYPSTGLMYSVTPSSTKSVEAAIDGSMLTVMLKAGADHKNYEFTVKATDGTSSDTVMFKARRNQAPMNAEGTAAAISNLAAIIEVGVTTRATAPMIWVLSSEEKTVKAHLANGKDTPADTIPVLIGDKAPLANDGSETQRLYFFSDDEGNKLSFVSDLSVGDAKTLMVTDGDMKVMLIGKASTFKPIPGNLNDGTDTPIRLMVSAIDDRGLLSDNEEHVLNVRVDMAPMTKGRIGTKVITLGTTDMDRVAIPDIPTYFTDDREADLDFYAWSDKPEIVSVSANPDNKDDIPLNAAVFDLNNETGDTDDTDDGFYVEGKGRGTAMITVKAKEKLATTSPVADGIGGSAGEKQSVTLTFMVEVN